MEITLHGFSGMGRGRRVPAGLSNEGLVAAQVTQPRT